jgi:prepilin-type N-terminal cleavage/methylation domain-containing protein
MMPFRAAGNSGRFAATSGAPVAPRTAFTLIELLVVVGVIVIMMTLAIPAFNAIRGGTDFTSEVYDLQGTLEQARAYAMANNTFVLVGIAEVSAAQSTSASPQANGTGRVAMAVIASKDGTRPYQNLLNTNSFQNWPSIYGSGGSFVAVTKLTSFQNLHMVDLQFNGSSPLTVPASGNMSRPALGSNGYSYDVPNVSGTSSTSFAWPLGSQLSGSTAPQYTFAKVIEYDPLGSARIISTTNLNAIPHYIEIGLQPTSGVTANPSVTGSTGQIAAIQIDGMSGATRIYRP